MPQRSIDESEFRSQKVLRNHYPWENGSVTLHLDSGAASDEPCS